MKWRNPFKRKNKGYTAEHFYSVHVDEENDVKLPAPTLTLPAKHHGGIRKVVAPQWSADQHRHGGRVVKAMPRNLKRMKELSEKTDD